jgi:hypothetical protein
VGILTTELISLYGQWMVATIKNGNFQHFEWISNMYIINLYWVIFNIINQLGTTVPYGIFRI